MIQKSEVKKNVILGCKKKGKEVHTVQRQVSATIFQLEENFVNKV